MGRELCRGQRREKGRHSPFSSLSHQHPDMRTNEGVVIAIEVSVPAAEASHVVAVPAASKKALNDHHRILVISMAGQSIFRSGQTVSRRPAIATWWLLQTGEAAVDRPGQMIMVIPLMPKSSLVPTRLSTSEPRRRTSSTHRVVRSRYLGLADFHLTKPQSPKKRLHRPAVVGLLASRGIPTLH